MKVGWIDPVLEPHELEAGEVQWAEVEKVANPWAETVKSEELDLLKRLIRAAAPEGSPEDKLKPGWYIYQGQWCSYDVESAHKICTEANIRVVGCPLSVYNDA